MHANEGVEMKYINLTLDKGKNHVSQICLGTARFGARIQEKMAFEMLDMFYQNGGNFLDTARNYDEWAEQGRGSSEKCIGRWMDMRGCRDEMVVCTKGGVRRRDGERVFDLSQENLCEEIAQSLESLRTNYIDIYLLHKDERERHVEEIIYSMQAVAEKGNVSKIGVANWKLERVRKANDYAQRHGLKPFEIIQTWWSLAEYTKEMWNDENTTWMTEDMYQYVLDNKLFAMAYTPQCKGFFQKAIRYGINEIDPFLMSRIATERNIKKLEYIKKVHINQGIPVTAIVNGYITCNPLSGVAIVSCSRTEQLLDVLTCSDYDIDMDIIQSLDKI